MYQLPPNAHWNYSQNMKSRHYQQQRRQPYNGQSNNRPHLNTDNCNADYWCETCDRGFKNKEILENHKAQHQKCNIDGCQFIAHPKVITKHIQMQHATGLYKKIATSDNPEDIKKWIEERKRRFPTKKNIELKAAELKEKVERGEKMGLSSRGLRRNENFNKKRKNNTEFKSHKRQKISKNDSILNGIRKPEKNIKQKEIPQIDDGQKLKPFTGLQNIINIDNNSDDESTEKLHFSIEDESDGETKIVENKPLVCGALSSLISNYDDSSDTDDNNLTNKKEKKLVWEGKTKYDNVKTQENSEKQNELDSGPEEVSIVKNNDTRSDTNYLTTSIKQTQKDSKVKEIKKLKQVKKRYTSVRSKVPSTLLEKLLSKEIQQERNIILQCIKYIVKNNYFASQNTC